MDVGLTWFLKMWIWVAEMRRDAVGVRQSCQQMAVAETEHNPNPDKISVASGQILPLHTSCSSHLTIAYDRHFSDSSSLLHNA